MCIGVPAKRGQTVLAEGELPKLNIRINLPNNTTAKKPGPGLLRRRESGNGSQLVHIGRCVLFTRGLIWPAHTQRFTGSSPDADFPPPD